MYEHLSTMATGAKSTLPAHIAKANTDPNSSFEITERRDPFNLSLDSIVHTNTQPESNKKTEKAGGRGSRGGGRGQKRNTTPPQRAYKVGRRGSLPDLTDLSDESFRDEMRQLIKVTVAETVAEAMKPLHSMIKDLKASIEEKNIENRELKNIVTKQEKSIQYLTDKVDSLEQYSRRSTVRIFNVDTDKYNEKLDTLIDDICVATDTYVQDQVVKCHWTGKTVENKRQVLVKFNNEKVRDSLLKKKSALRTATGDLTNIQIREDLTAARSRIFKGLRKLKTDGKLHSVWTYNGVLCYKHSEKGERHSLTTQMELDTLADSFDV